MTPERRTVQRQRTLLNGRVSFNRGNSTLDCVVRNLSDAGALLAMSDSVALPQAFDLDIPHRQRRYPARIRWRAADRVGVAFDAPKEEAGDPVPLDTARRIKRYEQDNALLRLRVQQLTEAG